ncbi:uncharacterized protein SEPMUDRAFT_116233 [Sphaerulina musiva SO2202]|uniref:Uncharacterized protein n=1 Tax=Sphaerulina musiva (strain SO2202) TaxID=692275 RepID=M3D5L1_SPHMS|nr:uncharacterized protein SEPMUDRAFT_116233 [Sphaerulina musiva SO2202]EMF13174.1 hypothetical protein SEPMUDRAFT_116233 [Sphaerulina musiva SO2202]
MFGKLTLHKKKSGQEDTNSSTPLLQRSDDDLKTRAQQQQQQQQQHQEREEEYQRLFPKRNDIQHHDDEDKIDQPDPTPHPVLRPKSSFPASGKRFLPRKKFLIPTSKFAVSQPTLPEPSSIPERDEHLPTVATPSVTYPDCRPPVKRVQARGCLFDIAPMPLSSHPPVDEKDDSSQPEGMQQSSSPSSPSSPSSTTHHRQERADSHQEDVTTPITTATATTNPEVTSRDFASTPRDVLTVPALTIRKNLLQPPTSTTSTTTSTTSTRIPSSPRSSPHSPSEKMSVPPQTAENERKRDSEAAYTTAKMALPTTTTSFREKLWGAGPSSSSSSAVAAVSNNKNDKASAGSKTFGFTPLRDQTRLIPAAGAAGAGATGGKATLPSSSSSPISSSGAIPVRPPLYDFHKPAGLQWASPGITNSRPAAPWAKFEFSIEIVGFLGEWR